MLTRYGKHQDGTDGRDDCHACNDDALLLDPSGDPAASHNGDNLNGSKGNIEQNGCETAVSK